MSAIFLIVNARIHLGSRTIFKKGGSSAFTLPAIVLADCAVVDAYLENGRIEIIPRRRKMSNEEGTLLMSVSVWLCFFIAFAQFAAVISTL